MILKNIEYIFENKPINRTKTKPRVEDKLNLLNILKKEIQNLDNCELKSHAKNFVFNDGSYESQ